MDFGRILEGRCLSISCCCGGEGRGQPIRKALGNTLQLCVRRPEIPPLTNPFLGERRWSQAQFKALHKQPPTPFKLHCHCTFNFILSPLTLISLQSQWLPPRPLRLTQQCSRLLQRSRVPRSSVALTSTLVSLSPALSAVPAPMALSLPSTCM